VRIQFDFLRSKVAQRIALLFVLCALIPILALSFLSFRQVTQQLRQQSQERLFQSNKAMGMAIYERLLILEAEMAIISAQIRVNPHIKLDVASRDLKIRLERKFKGLWLVPEQSPALILLGEDPAPELTIQQYQHIRSGETLVFYRLLPEYSARIFMAVKMTSPELPASYFAAEIDPGFLWNMGYEETLPYWAEFSVYDHENRLLFSSLPQPYLLADRPNPSRMLGDSGSFEWSYTGEKYLASSRDLFIQSQFYASKWTLVLSEASSYIQEPLDQFKRTFPLVILLSLWVVLFLSFSQIRRSLIPLEKLKEGAQRISQRDFESQIIVKSGDEFEDVAETFNDMSATLGRQFKALKMMSAIDRAVLSSRDARTIVESLLTQIHNICPCQGVCIALLEPTDKMTGNTYFRAVGESQKIQVSEIELLPHDLKLLKEQNDKIYVSGGSISPSFLLSQDLSGLKYFFISPVFLKNMPAAIVSLGFYEEPMLSQDEMNNIRQLTDQVGVALSNTRLLEELQEINLGILAVLARAIDAKSHWTAGHSERVTEFALKIGKTLALTHKQLDMIHRGGLLHDIGKLGIPNQILDKPVKLTPKEKQIVQTHTTLGARILEPIAAYSEVVRMALEHHENFDGSGYPQGLKGKNISLYSRILAVADNFDALSSDRPYRRALKRGEVIHLIKIQSGKKFDPLVVDAFLRVIKTRGG